MPDLWIHVDGLTPAGEVLVLEQYANGRDDAALPPELQSIEMRLKKMTGPDLANAKDASGQFLLKATIRSDSASTAALANGFSSCMKLASKQPTATPLHPLISREGAWTGAHIHSSAAALDWNRVTPHAGLPSWSLTFAEDGVQYQTHTPDEAQMIIAEMRTNANPATDADGTPWWSTIGDFLEAIVEGFVNTVVKIKSIVVNGVTAAFEFVMKGVSYVFNAVVNFVQDSFDMIESILATVYESVAKFFEKTFEWIGFLFDWKDILRTREALAYTLTQVLDFVPLIIDDVKLMVDNGFGKLNAAVNQAFTQLKGQVANSNVGGFADSNRRSDPVFMHSAGNNFVMNGVVNNASAAKPSSVSTAVTDTGKIDDFMAALQHFANFDGDPNAKNAFSSMQGYMKTASSTPDNILTQSLTTLIDLVQKLVEAVISGVHALIQKAFEALALVVRAIGDILKAEWKIPLVTAFYSHITNGSPLTILDVLSLVIAIPTTTIFKLLRVKDGKAPFPTQKSVEDFKKLFTPAILRNNYKGITTNAGDIEDEALSVGDAMSEWKGFLAWSTAFAEYGYWGLSAINDVLPPNVPLPSDEIRAKVTLGFECAAACFSFPWFTAPFAAPNWKFTPPYNPAGAANAAWLFDTLVGVILIDGVSVVLLKKLPENWTDAGVAIANTYNCANVVFAGIACAGASHLDRTVLILPLIPNFVKLGRLSAIVTFTEGASLAVVALSDFLFGSLIAIVTGLQGNIQASPRMLAASQPAM